LDTPIGRGLKADQDPLLIVGNFVKKKIRAPKIHEGFFCKFCSENQGEITGRSFSKKG
jgi:hypothetical protein